MIRGWAVEGVAAVVRVGEHGRGIRGGCGEDGHH